MRPAPFAALAVVALGCATAPRFAPPEPVGDGAHAGVVLRPTWSEPLGEATSDGSPARTSPFVVGLDRKGRVLSSQHFGYRAARSLVRGAAVDRDQQLVLAGAFGTYAYWRDPAEGFLVWLEAAPRTALR